MNDKTEQSVTDEPCGTAAGGRAEIINVPGYPLMVRAVDYNTLRAQLAEARRDAGRLNWIDQQTQLSATPRGQPWIIGHTTIFGLDFRAAIDAAKGETR